MSWEKLPYMVERKQPEEDGDRIRKALSRTTPISERVELPKPVMERYVGLPAGDDSTCPFLRASLYTELVSRNVEWDFDTPYDPSRELYDMVLARVPSRYSYFYKVQPVGSITDVSRLSGEAAAAVRAKRASLLHLKAYFFALFVAGFPVNALAEGGSANPFTKYGLLAELCGRKMSEFLAYVLVMVTRLSDRVTLDWYRDMTPEFQALVDMVAFTVVLVLLFYLSRDEKFELVPLKGKKKDQFLGQVLSETGMIYKVRVNGKVYDLTATDEGTGCHQDEMAMPGSEYFPCKQQPIGAILVTNDKSNIQLFGTFWRLDEYFVTARHCSNTLAQSTARVYLAPVRRTKRGNYEINKDSMFRAPDDFFSPENNVIAGFEVDVFAMEVSQKVWSSIGLNKASTRVRSAYGQQVHSVGFTGDGLLVSASGKTLPDSGHELLFHTASTQKGFSGSIILCGNSVVGMHVSAAGDYNVAVRVELIKYLIDEGTSEERLSKNRKKYTYADASYKEFYRQHKFRGGVVGLKVMRNGKYAIVLENGEATYGWDRAGLVECFGPTGDAFRDEDFFEDMIMDSVGFKERSRGQYVDYDDDRYHRDSFENASISSVRAKTPKKKKVSSKKVVVQDSEKAYSVTEGLRKVHGPTTPKVQPEAVQVFEDFKQEIIDLGYEEGLFAYPDMSPVSERKSLEAHLRLFNRRVRNVVKEPTEEEVKRCCSIVAQMMQPASFLPATDYRTQAGVLDIIHSPIVDPSKSAGFPYCADGIPTNKQVLEKFGEKGFATHVLDQWDELEVQLKLFLKGEPTKRSKLVKDMPRVIAGFPLHVTVKHAAIFRPLMQALTAHWKQTPVKFSFAPGNPGHIEHLASVLDGKVWESDKSTWDYNFLMWIATCCRDVTKMLALKPPSWSEEQYQQYLSDIDGAFKQVFETTAYRTSDGHLYKPTHPGIMKSGWFMTIAQNSIAQLVVHVMTCIRLGYSDDEIAQLAIVVGGDDVNQEPVPAGVDAYVAAASDLGIPMEIQQRESLFHSEYFSSDLRGTREKPEFYPKRWTKHIEHIKVIKREHLGGALISHMRNYRHDVKKFDVLSRMYHALSEKFPNSFPINQLVSRQLLIAEQYGYESMYSFGDHGF
jgi:hypothetical protein